MTIGAPDIPVATYRVQLTPDLTFEHAAEIVPYLAKLGVSHLYVSPIFEARPGSTHGYDQTDPTRLRAELGADAGFTRLADAARAAGLRIIVDFVPNHMAAHHLNPWWWGLLAEGRGSRFDRFFDVFWSEADGRIVLPVLGAPLEQAIENGEIRLASDESGRGLSVEYFDKRFPLRAASVEAAGDDPASLRGGDLLRVLGKQHYELAFWRTGLPRVNYRRFFDIAELVGVRVEDPEVFDVLHAGLFQLVRDGLIHGVRLDHVDGLADPRAYCRRLRERLASLTTRSTLVYVEKILAQDETLPDDWQIDGTSGYDFLAAAAAVQVRPEGVDRLRQRAQALGDAPARFERLKHDCKAEVAVLLLGPERLRVARRVADALGGADEDAVARCLTAIAACLDVYRTYADEDGLSEQDRSRLTDAVRRAEADVDAADRQAFSAVSGVLLLGPPFDSGPQRQAALSAIRVWQQLTGPLAAKGVEDTALYRDAAMPALNDVGSEPEQLSARAARRRLASRLSERADRWPAALNATSTHDTKRGEDTRARIAAVSWDERAIDLFEHAREQAETLLADLRPVPHPTLRRLALYTTMALLPDDGAHAALGDRLKDYLRKASREAKLGTTWLDPDAAYETACATFVDRLLGAEGTPIVKTLREVASRTRRHAAVQSLGTVLMKSLTPGVPDFYQGCELPDLSLVDPDNRRPVDWQARRQLLDALAAAWRRDPPTCAAAALSDPGSDAAKMFITWRAVALRRWLLAQFGPIRVAACSSRLWRLRAGDQSVVVRLRPQSGEQLHRRSVTNTFGVNQLTGLRGFTGPRGPVPALIEVREAHSLIGR